MAGRYIPPHLRGASKSSTLSDSSTPTPERDPAKGYSYEEVSNQFECKAKLGTLNSASEDGVNGSTQQSLSFIIVFKDQHPEWPPKIFCKSNLNLLPTMLAPSIDAEAKASASSDSSITARISQATESPMSPGTQAGGDHVSPIPIFTQFQARPPTFLYDGVRSIKSVTYLQPGSPELIELLNRKFGSQRKERTSESWQSSLSTKWAVVEMGEAEKGRNPMVPLKKMKDEKSVNEMLREMRVRDVKEVDRGGGDGSAVGEE